MNRRLMMVTPKTPSRSPESTSAECLQEATRAAEPLEPPLQSGVLYSPADNLLRQAISRTLEAPAGQRPRLFGLLAAEIEFHIAENYPQRPWTCRTFSGTDGSTIFRGGVGHSLVIDSSGRLWRARSYEDFETTYKLENGTCEIDRLTPLYGQMQEYRVDDTVQISPAASD